MYSSKDMQVEIIKRADGNFTPDHHAKRGLEIYLIWSHIIVQMLHEYIV